MSFPETTPAAPPLAAPVPEAFFKAQARNRRATIRLSALCVFAAFLMGIPLTLVLTPVLYAAGLAIAEVVNQFSPLPPSFWQSANDLARLAYRVADAVINQRAPVDPQQLAIAIAVVFLPGIVAALGLWASVLLLFRHGGVGGTIASLNARPPNPSDLKELQLADVVQEMAIAAGLPAPKVMLIDSAGANAAAIGTGAADAHIVLTRRLLDDLNRDQLQALVGHLVASVGNGDLRIAFTVTSVFETCGLIVTLINAPFGRQSRSTLWRIVRYKLRRGSANSAADAEEVAELLADMLDMNSSDIDRFFNSRNPGLFRKILRLFFFPFLFTNLAVELTLWFFLNVLLGPCMALLWRTRCYLADAGAVELTRNPDALASALQQLSEDNTAVAGGSWAAHLFVLNPGGDHSLRGDEPSADKQRKAIAAWRAAALGAGAAAHQMQNVIPAAAGDFASARREIMSTVMAAATGDQQALGRLQAFAQATGLDRELGLHGVADIQNLILAQRGDRAAMARIRMLGQRNRPPEEVRRRHHGPQNVSFVSFHPPLKKRAKRLQRMGARLAEPAKKGGGILGKILVGLLYLFVTPVMAAAVVVMLGVIVMMISLNLIFLALWMTFIHWAFAQDWQRNIQAFVGFVQQVVAAFNKHR